MKTFLCFCFCLCMMGTTLFAQNDTWEPAPSWGDYNHAWLGTYRMGQTAIGIEHNSNKMLRVSNSSRNKHGEDGQTPFLLIMEDYSGKPDATKAITVWDMTVEGGLGSNFQVLGNGQTFVGTSQHRVTNLEGPQSIPWPWEAMLWVNGNIVAEEVRVALYEDWPDYVFEDNYQRLTLPQLQQYIHQNGHLPNIPSAADMETEGKVDLGEISRLQMEKIEELTLYILDLNEEQELLWEENARLQEQLNELARQVKALQK